MLKIFGANLSSPANKVRFTANYLGLDYEYVQVNIREGENRTAEYLSMNPSGKVPAIDDDGFKLFESGAICRYLCAKHNSDLYPADLKTRAEIDAWIDFVAIHIVMALNRVTYNRIIAKFINAPVDEQSLKDGLSFLEKFFPIVDAQLAKSKYLAGVQISLADITLLSATDPVEAAQVDISAYKNLVKWREAMQKEGFYTKCHNSYQEIIQKLMAAK